MCVKRQPLVGVDIVGLLHNGLEVAGDQRLAHKRLAHEQRLLLHLAAIVGACHRVGIGVVCVAGGPAYARER